MHPPSGAVDYLDKYSGSVREAVAEGISPEVEAALTKAALLAHEACRLGTYSRADFRLDSDNTAWLLEVKSAPGLTARSLFSIAADAAGISFATFCERLIAR